MVDGLSDLSDDDLRDLADWMEDFIAQLNEAHYGITDVRNDLSMPPIDAVPEDPDRLDDQLRTTVDETMELTAMFEGVGHDINAELEDRDMDQIDTEY